MIENQVVVARTNVFILWIKNKKCAGKHNQYKHFLLVQNIVHEMK